MTSIQGILSIVLSFCSIIGIGVTIGIFQQKTSELEKKTEVMAEEIKNISDRTHTNVMTFFEKYNEVSISMAKVSEQIASLSVSIDEIKTIMKEREK